MKTPAASTKIGEYSLAIDTSAGTTVAVLSMGSVLAELNYLEPMTHSERIGSAIEQVIRDAGLEAKILASRAIGELPLEERALDSAMIAEQRNAATSPAAPSPRQMKGS